MAFPQIRVNNDAAKKYIRRGQQLLFKLQEMKRTQGVPILQQVFEIDEYTTILVQISKEQEFVDIRHNPPPVEKEKPKPVFPSEDLPSCPPAFVLYARKRWDTTENKDYILAYNEKQDTWVLASVDPYLGASNTGYWPVHDKGDEHASCDVVTWDGQPGGFSDWGYFGAGHFQNTYATGTAERVDYHGVNLYCAGNEIKGIGARIIAAGIFLNSSEELRYFILTHSGSPNLEIHEGTMPGPDGTGLIEPTWTLKTSFLYTDYADSVLGGWNAYWGPCVGNAFINQNGEAFISIPIERDIVTTTGTTHQHVLHLLKIDMVNGTLEILRDNLDAIPYVSAIGDYNYVSGSAGPGPLSAYFSYCITPTPETPPIGGSTNAERTCSGATSYNNKGRPLLVRTFGGLDSLYTYEMETSYDYSHSYNATVNSWTENNGLFSIDCDFGGGPITKTYTWYGWTGIGSITRNDNEEGITTVYVYDHGPNGDSKREIDSLVVYEKHGSVTATQSYSPVAYPLTETFLDIYVLSPTRAIVSANFLGSVGPITGTGIVTTIRRTILDHHPQIANSWVYAEVEQTYDVVQGVCQENIYRIVEHGKVTLTFTSQVGDAGFFGHEFFDPSVKARDADPAITIPYVTTTTAISGPDPDGVYLDWNTGFQNIASGSVWWPDNDVTALTKRFFQWFTYNSGPNLQPEPMYILGTDGVLSLGLGGGPVNTHFALNENTFGAGKWASDTGATFKENTGWDAVNLGSAAVHRIIKGIRPYVWLKRKIYADTSAACGIKHGLETARNVLDVKINSAPSGACEYTLGGGDWQNEIAIQIGESDRYSVFWTQWFDVTQSRWQTLAEDGEWYIESNVLSDADILRLTKEEQLDVYGIAII